MYTATKTASAALLAAAAILTAPVSAGETKQDIVVTSTEAMAQWQKATTRNLNQALKAAPIARKIRPNNAVVEIAFTIGADGRAEGVSVLDGRGNWAAREAASYAVRQLETLSDVPVSNRGQAQFLASIVFADNRAVRERLIAEAKTARKIRMAAATGNDEFILLGG